MREYFKGLYGNEKSKIRLGDSILAARLPHALLIDGPDGSGKLTMAKEIAAALNCENKGNSACALPCGVCNSCQKIRANGHTDVKILAKQEGKATIGVAEVSELKSDCYLSATEAEYKVYIIDGAERMTAEAQNSLLILLEEPPRRVVIMLLSESSDKILTTIKSRCQYIPMERFSPGALDTLLTRLSEQYKRLKAQDPDKCGEITVLADGRLGRALELAGLGAAASAKDGYGEAYALISAIAKKSSYRELYGAVSSLPVKRQELNDRLELIMNGLRDLTLAKEASVFTPLFLPSVQRAKELADGVSLTRLGKVFDAVNEAHEAIFKNANVGATLTVLSAKIKNSY